MMKKKYAKKPELRAEGGRIGFKKGTDKNGFKKLQHQLKKEEPKENVHRLLKKDVQDELKL